jgi:hypothetical protein
MTHNLYYVNLYIIPFLFVRYDLRFLMRLGVCLGLCYGYSFMKSIVTKAYFWDLGNVAIEYSRDDGVLGMLVCFLLLLSWVCSLLRGIQVVT